MTAFVISAALAQAKLIIAQHERTVLSAKDYDVVLAALDTPAEPTDALRQAMVLHETGVIRDG